MAKFKLNDRVKSTSRVGSEGAVGAIGTIVYYRNDEDFLVHFDEEINGHSGNIRSYDSGDNRCWWVSKYNVELLKEEPKPTPKPKFKEGDRVKAIAPCDHQERFLGEVGTVVEVNNFPRLSVLVRFDNNVSGHGDGNREWWCEKESLELFVEEPKPTPTPTPTPITVNLNVTINYDNSCWYCRKGGLVDLYLAGRPGICPKCGRLCNAIGSIEIAKPTVSKPKTNNPLTDEELKALPDGAKVFVVYVIDGIEQLNHEWTCWRTVEVDSKDSKFTKLKRKVGYGNMCECNKATGSSYHVYLEKPEDAVDSGN